MLPSSCSDRGVEDIGDMKWDSQGHIGLHKIQYLQEKQHTVSKRKVQLILHIQLILLTEILGVVK